MNSKDLVGLCEAYSEIYESIGSSQSTSPKFDIRNRDINARAGFDPRFDKKFSTTLQPTSKTSSTSSLPSKSTTNIPSTQTSRSSGSLLSKVDTTLRDVAGRVGGEIGAREGRSKFGNVFGIPERIGRSKGTERAQQIYDRAKQTVSGFLKQDYDYDVFDVILEHLVAEGYADTNQAALAIMANMSEEWRESIVDESRGAELRAKHGDNPSKKLETKAFGKAMSYGNRDRLATGQTGTEARAQYLGLSGRARSRAGGETPASSAVGSGGESRRVRSRGGRARGIGAGENRDRPTG